MMITRWSPHIEYISAAQFEFWKMLTDYVDSKDHEGTLVLR